MATTGRKRAPKLKPPEDPVALIDAWAGFHERVMDEFQPQARILFIPSCSGDKPYYLSPSHKEYQRILDEVAPGQVDKVTLSGILGPVPASMEELVAEQFNYNFYLSRYAHLKGQLPQITQRLVKYMSDFLAKYGSHYDLRVSYSRENYKRVMIEVANRVKQHPIVILPKGDKALLDGGLDQLRATLSKQ